MKTYQLESDTLKIKINPLGAELNSIYHKTKQVELLWEGNSEFWGRQSPLLFPIVGELKNREYQWKGDTFKMRRHGFARNKMFELLEVSDNKLFFILKSNDDTLANYPFHFELIVGYELKDNELIHSYKIKNTDESEMWYSIGGHPAYALPNAFTNYTLQLNKTEPNLKRTKLNDKGLRVSVEDFTLDDNNTFQLHYNLFEEDAIVFEQLNSDEISLFHNDDKVLQMTFKDFPFFGIWTLPNAPYICLEPWQGIADAVDASGQLQEKKGILKLEANNTDQFSYNVTFY